MNSLYSILERNKAFAAQQSAARTYALTPGGAARCKGNHHWLRRYARGPCAYPWN